MLIRGENNTCAYGLWRRLLLFGGLTAVLLTGVSCNQNRLDAVPETKETARVRVGVPKKLSPVATAKPRPAGDSLMLIEHKQPRAVLVVPPGSNRKSAEIHMAELINQTLRQIADTELLVVDSAKLGEVSWEGGRMLFTNEELAVSNLVFVGASPPVELIGVDTVGIGPGGIRLLGKGNTLTLLGGPESIPGEVGSDNSGLRNAVVELLEQLGCRYLWPGRTGTVIPRGNTVMTPPIDITYTPAIRRRSIRWGGATGERTRIGLEKMGVPEEVWLEVNKEAFADDSPLSWFAWQRLGGSMPSFGHAGGGLSDAEEQMKLHPEWFALQADGTRDQLDSRFRLCISNRELIEHVARDIIARVDAKPDTQLVSLDPNDGGSNAGWCLCDKCKALDPPNAPKIRMTLFHAPAKAGQLRRRESIEAPAITDRFVYYWNSIAEIVTQKHPDLLFGVSAYSSFSTAPVANKLHPNLVVRYVPFQTDSFVDWQQAGAKRIFWRPNILGTGRRDGKLRCYVGKLAENTRFFVDAGVNQTDMDSILHSWSTLGMNYYAAARLNWNPYLAPEEIINDFAVAGFGRGAPDIIAYFNRIEMLTTGGRVVQDDDDAPEQANDPGIRSKFETIADYKYTPETVAELRALLAAAEAKAASPLVSERVAFLRLGLNFTELQERLDYLSLCARENLEYDRDEASSLIDLNTLVIREMLQNHATAVNIPGVVWGSGTFARFAPIRGRRARPANKELEARLGKAEYRLTGREEGIPGLLAAFGMD